MSVRIAVVGAGPGGYVAAIRAAQAGADVTLVEKEALGGTCLNWGCIPSKVMVSAAALMQEIRHASRFGIELERAPRLNMEALQTRQASVILTQQKGIESLLRHHKIRVVYGKARIEKEGLLSITSGESRETLAWDRLILAPGTRPASLPSLPVDGIFCLSSNDFLRMKSLPASAVILGAGVVGCEFASILSGLGCKVDLVEMADRILPLPDLDPGASRLLMREFKKRGIGLHTGKKIVSMEQKHQGLRLELQKTAAPETSGEEIHADCLVLCVGRSPNTEDLGLETLNLQTDARGYIPVNDAMETAVPGVFAIGDVTGPERVMLAHVASMEGDVAAENAMGGKRLMDYSATPSAIFTEPEVAFVGLSLEKARAKGLTARSTAVLFRSMGKAHATDALSGEAIMVTEEGSGRIVGCHLVGRHATELVAEATLAVSRGLKLKDLAETLHAHPSFSEIFSELAFKGTGRGLHG